MSFLAGALGNETQVLHGATCSRACGRQQSIVCASAGSSRRACRNGGSESRGGPAASKMVARSAAAVEPATADVKKAGGQLDRVAGGGAEGVPFKDVFDDFALGYTSLTAADEKEAWVEASVGEIPQDLEGTLLRNGPAQWVVSGTTRNYLDGDGMISALAFKDGRAYFKNKFVRTDSFIREQDAGRCLDLSIFTREDPRKPVLLSRLGDIFNGPPSPKNAANYNVLHWAGQLAALDWGKPHGMDSETFETVGAVDDFTSSKFTAHFRIVAEPDGSGDRLVCFDPKVDWGAGTTTVTFIEFDASGKEVKRSAFDFEATYFHDLVVTDHWYILFDNPIKMSLARTFLGYPLQMNSLSDTVVENPSSYCKFRLFPRREGLKPQVLPAQYCFAYHHVNGFDTDGGKKVVFDTCTWERFTLYFSDIVTPDGSKFYPRTKVSRFVMDTETGKVEQHFMSERPSEYPTVAPVSTGKPYSHMYMSSSALRDTTVNGPLQCLMKLTLDPESAGPAKEEVWLPGPRKFAHEPIFVPKPGGTEEDEGWLLVMVFDAETRKSEVSILDAQSVQSGPICTMPLPQFIPFGIHGSFTPAYLGPK